MTVTLVATICLGVLCQDVAVPTENMLAGKASNPVAMTLEWPECAVHGQQIALDWLVEEKKHGGQYADWKLKPPIKCVPGHWESGKRA